MEKSFETSLAELEQIVGRLESGELSLEDSLELFEKGINLSRECRSRLSSAERRIEILVNEAGGGLAAKEMSPDELRPAAAPGRRIVFADDDAPF